MAIIDLRYENDIIICEKELESIDSSERISFLLDIPIKSEHLRFLLKVCEGRKDFTFNLNYKSQGKIDGRQYEFLKHFPFLGRLILNHNPDSYFTELEFLKCCPALESLDLRFYVDQKKCILNM